MSDPRNLPPPRIDVPRNGTISNGSPTKPALSDSKPSFLAPFLGAFAAVVIIALVAGGGYLGWTYFHGSSQKVAKSPLMNVAQWQEGPVMPGSLAEPVKSDIGWWTSHFDLPNINAQVSEYLKAEGLNVSNIEPIHYKDNADTTVLTYQVTVSVPGELLRVPQATWTTPSNPDEARFISILVLNKGLPAGTYWDTRNAKVEVSANNSRTTLFNVRWDKATNTITADRLLPTDLVTPQQVADYQNETQGIVNSLDQHLQQIDAQVKQETQARLAQIPPDPPKPKPQVAHFGGDGSGEPTKSAERIGGGAAAGAAGGALFGSAAGNAGMGAGIGAGVGLLGGIIYNAVSKSNDKAKLEAEVADENQEALDNWRDEIKSLKQQRAQIPKDAAKEREAALNNLANQISANNGYLEPIAANGSNQPTGPVQRQ
jgi:hypothetical protein